jgi:hypothetical protein
MFMLKCRRLENCMQNEMMMTMVNVNNEIKQKILLKLFIIWGWNLCFHLRLLKKYLCEMHFSENSIKWKWKGFQTHLTSPRFISIYKQKTGKLLGSSCRLRQQNISRSPINDRKKMKNPKICWQFLFSLCLISKIHRIHRWAI